MDSKYDNDFSKIALAATAAQMAKATGVKELGIGEDLAMNFFAWGPEELVAVCQASSSIMNLDPEKRLSKCARLCSILRRYWWATSITMVAEGFFSADKESTRGMELSKAFIDRKNNVKECLTICHVTNEPGMDDVAISMVAIPYEYELGRKVIWHEMVVYPAGPQESLRNFKYPEMLCEAMEQRFTEEDDDDVFDELRQMILASGFLMHELA